MNINPYFLVLLGFNVVQLACSEPPQRNAWPLVDNPCPVDSEICVPNGQRILATVAPPDGIYPTKLLVKDGIVALAAVIEPEKGGVWVFDHHNPIPRRVIDSGDFTTYDIALAWTSDALVVGFAYAWGIEDFTSQGQVHVVSIDTWESTILPERARALPGLGLAANDDQIFVGAPFRISPELSYGALVVYERNNGGWEEAQVLVGSTLGMSVLADENLLAVSNTSNEITFFERSNDIWNPSSRASLKLDRLQTPMQLRDESLLIGDSQLTIYTQTNNEWRAEPVADKPRCEAGIGWPGYSSTATAQYWIVGSPPCTFPEDKSKNTGIFIVSRSSHQVWKLDTSKLPDDLQEVRFGALDYEDGVLYAATTTGAVYTFDINL